MREIKEFKIYCSHEEKGCEWVGELGALKEHLDSNEGCAYVKVQCTNKAYKCRSYRNYSRVTCEASMERRHFTYHQRNLCVYRQYTCEYCGYTDTYDAIVGSGQIRNRRSNISSPNNHFSECGNYPLDCPNECGEKNIKRKDMKAHQDSCPLEPLDCPFQAVGCSADKRLRRDMDSHCQENMQEHLLLVVQSHQELAHKNEELAGKVDELTTKIKAITKK